MTNNDFDFVNYLSEFVDKLPTKDKIIMKYLNNEITKDELDKLIGLLK